MTWIDWLFVALPLLLVFGVALYTHRFVKSVADFLSGGRCARRYLLANARGESDSGLANTMSKFEIIMVSGFVLNFWDKLTVPILLLFGISGFVVYRFRETRALTLAQFLEARYSRGFRLFMGGLAFVSGVLNYGIFPAVSARFFIYFLDLPHYFEFGHVTFSTFATIMFVYLSATVFMILVGGQVTAMVTDCIEGILSHAAYIAIVICVFYLVGWHHIVETMSAPPPGKSMINPFDAKDVEDFNVWYAVMALLLSAYGTMAFQNRQGFNSAAKTPHESRMGGVLGHWRNYARGLMLLMLGLCAVTYLRHPELQQASEGARQAIGSVKDAYIQKQMTVPIALSHLLPIGIKGLFVAIMVMGLLAGDAGHIHSWGSIFVQDVILPLKKKPMSPGGHILALRLSVIGVAAFALGFSILFSQSQYITLWMALSASVFVAGAGVAIIGGLYSRRGTAAGAWAGAITGSLLSLVGVALTTKDVWPIVASGISKLGVAAPAKFWLNGQQVAFVAAGSAVAVYVVVSLLTGRGRRFDLDALLHRAGYEDKAIGLQSRVGAEVRFELLAVGSLGVGRHLLLVHDAAGRQPDRLHAEPAGVVSGHRADVRLGAGALDAAVGAVGLVALLGDHRDRYPVRHRAGDVHLVRHRRHVRHPGLLPHVERFEARRERRRPGDRAAVTAGGARDAPDERDAAPGAGGASDRTRIEDLTGSRA
ncbi:MAG: hypothetical protein QM770_04395 [Tepidisphaeraceae bacterium]